MHDPAFFEMRMSRRVPAPQVGWCRGLLCVVVLISHGVGSEAAKVDMHGHCAVVARSSLWNHDDKEVDPETGQKTGPLIKSTPRWDYKIKERGP